MVQRSNTGGCWRALVRWRNTSRGRGAVSRRGTTTLSSISWKRMPAEEGNDARPLGRTHQVEIKRGQCGGSNVGPTRPDLRASIGAAIMIGEKHLQIHDGASVRSDQRVEISSRRNPFAEELVVAAWLIEFDVKRRYSLNAYLPNAVVGSIVHGERARCHRRQRLTRRADA